MDLASFNLLPLLSGKKSSLETGFGAYGVGLSSTGVPSLRSEFQALLGDYLKGGDILQKKEFFLWLSTHIKGLLSKETQGAQVLTDSEREFLNGLIHKVEELLGETGLTPLAPAIKGSASEVDKDDGGEPGGAHENGGPFLDPYPFGLTTKEMPVEKGGHIAGSAQAEAKEGGSPGIGAMVEVGGGLRHDYVRENSSEASNEKGSTGYKWIKTVLEIKDIPQANNSSSNASPIEAPGGMGRSIVDNAFLEDGTVQVDTIDTISDALASSQDKTGKINHSPSQSMALGGDNDLFTLLDAAFSESAIEGAVLSRGRDLERIKVMLYSILKARRSLGEVDSTSALKPFNSIVIDEGGENLLGGFSSPKDDGQVEAIAGEARPLDNETLIAVNLDKGRTSEGPKRLFEGGDRNGPTLFNGPSHGKKDVLHQGPSPSSEALGQGGKETPLKGLGAQPGAGGGEAIEETLRPGTQEGAIREEGGHKPHSTTDSRHTLSGPMTENDATARVVRTPSNKELDGAFRIHIPKDAREEIVGIVARNVTNALDKGEHIVKIRLHPPELGRIHVDLRVDRAGNGVRATFFADVNEVRGLLQQHHHLLKETLVQHGYQLHDFSVHSLAPDADLDSGLGWFGGTGSGYETGANAQNNAPWQRGDSPQSPTPQGGLEVDSGMASQEGGASGTGISVRV